MSITFQVIITIIPIIGGFLYWHFKTVNNFKDQVMELKLELKNLEKKDELQQQTIDQLKELFPILKDAVEFIKNSKQIKK
jgi:hypothetical protein